MSAPMTVQGDRASQTDRPPQFRITIAVRMGLVFVANLVLAVVLFSRWEWSEIYWSVMVGWPAASPLLLVVQGAFLFSCLVTPRRFIPPLGRRSAVMIGGLSLAVVVLLGWLALDSFPNSGDEYAYLFQSWTYQAGRLWNAAPPLGQAMGSNYTWVYGARWAGQYAPGWPLLMDVPLLLGLPGWTANLPLLAVSVAMLFDMVARRSGIQMAALAAGFFAVAPFTLFQAASYFSHLFVATLALLAYWAHDRLVEQERRRWAALLAAAIGILALTRVFAAFVVAIPLAIALMRRRRFWERYLWVVVASGLPFVAMLLWYQFELSGDWLKPTYYIGGRTDDHLYFSLVALKYGLSITIERLQELSLWGCPLIAPLLFASLVMKARYGRIEAADAAFLIGGALLIFYPANGGNRYGPRYYFDFWSLMIFTIATGIPLMRARWASFGRTTLALSCLYGVMVTPLLGACYGKLVREREELYRRAKALPGGPAIICVRSSVGLHLPLGQEDLARNGIDPTGSQLFVNCSHGVPVRLRSVYPERKVWFYTRGLDQAQGRFSPMVQ